MIETTETAVIVGITQKYETPNVTQEFLDELSQLALTAGAVEIGRFTQKLEHPHRRTFLGPGKLLEVKEFVDKHKADMVIFDDELSPSQLKNIEKTLECKVLDRNNLILDIFATRAQTAQAKTQVELAQLEYLLPRLTRMWTHLERQKGGIGLRGPGETQIETDRRIIRTKISLLKEKLQQIEKQHATRKKRREEKVRVSLVGYTNAGKSTLMNTLTKSNVLAEDKLFATLDTTVKEIVIDRVTFLLSDTVGFIRKLPHSLVESFKSTLDEVRESDIIMHVVDVSHPHFEKHINVVNETLAELGASGKPYVMVFNKIDKLSQEFFLPEKSIEDNIEHMENNEDIEASPLEERLKYLRKTWMGTGNENVVFISAENKMNMDRLKNVLLKQVKKEYQRIYPYLPKFAGG